MAEHPGTNGVTAIEVNLALSFLPNAMITRHPFSHHSRMRWVTFE